VIWNFLQRYDESWIWRRADGREVTESSRNFAGREECVQDAARHGYVEGRSARAGGPARGAKISRQKRKTSRLARTF
jgi:hypothetical protein